VQPSKRKCGLNFLEKLPFCFITSVPQRGLFSPLSLRMDDFVADGAQNYEILY